MAQSWLGIDPGLAIIGWAILEEADYGEPFLIDYGTIETSKKLPTPQRLLEIEQDIAELLGEFQPDNIVIEMPFLAEVSKLLGESYKLSG